MRKKLKNKKVLVVFKPIGKTPLEVIERCRQENPEIRDQKIGYAGRLDPMAEGVLILLLGDENKEKTKYENLQKVYDIEILLGFATDTYDILGKITSKEVVGSTLSLAKIKTKLKSFVGKFGQEYPPFSSKTVNGKPLYYYARRNLLSEIKIPKRRVEIFGIDNVSSRKIKGLDLLKMIEEKITIVNGDFRQKEIIKGWQDNLKESKDTIFTVVSLTVKCSSGTYMRSLAYNFGKRIGVPSLALSIKRISVGDFKID